MRNVQGTFTQIVEEVPYLPEELQIAVANIDDPSALQPPHRRLAAADDRGEAGAARGGRRRQAAAPAGRASWPASSRSSRSARGSSPRSSPRSTRPSASSSCASSSRRSRRSSASSTSRPPRPTSCASSSTAIELPEEVRKQAERELERLETLPPQAAEHGVIRTYLEWIASLPWAKATEDNLDLGHAREVLDEDHYDIEQVKDRILEFLAVRRLKPDARGSILCFVGPPGVGKTSLGRSIARALGREFERISVGGVRDEAEIRGHRRTYIGAMPGTIIRALRDAGSQQPAVHDRRDRQDGRGLPRRSRQRDARGARPRAELDASATTTSTCRSTSRTSCSSRTANTLDTVPGPLRDRMEVIQLAGYTEEEKLEIAKRYLVPRQIERNGLKKRWISIRRPRAARDHRRLHARGRRARPRARDRHGLPQGRARDRRGRAGRPRPRNAASISEAAGARAAGQARGSSPRPGAARAAGRRHRPGLDAGRRRRAVHRGDGDARARAT